MSAGDVVIADVDCVLGTDGSAPMAIDYFGQMAGTRLAHPERVFFALDHYAPPTTPQTQEFHRRTREFAQRFGATVFEVGEGISHQLAVERGLVRAGDLVIGADSHTVTCGALNAFAIGVGSSDLAAAMLTGQVWLRVPESIRVELTGLRRPMVSAKDVALELVGRLGADGANYEAIEFTGSGLDDLPLDDRLVLSNMLVESGAKAAIFPHDVQADVWLSGRGLVRGAPVAADRGAQYERELALDLADVAPRVALPHSPANVATLEEAAGEAVQMVFIGTCTGGRVRDYHQALAMLQRYGGRVAPGVRLVLTPASREVAEELEADGTLPRFRDMGAEVTTPGCGACCGTSGVLPEEGATVLSTANRNFRARMGTATARIFLASPAACGAAAATGRITPLTPSEPNAGSDA